MSQGSTVADADLSTPRLSMGKPSQKLLLLERMAGWATVTVVLAAALPLGSNRPWAWLALAALAGCIYFVLAIRDMSGAASVSEAHGVLARLRVPGLLYLAVIAWILLQTVPWLPESWLHPAWQTVGSAAGETAAISVDPDRTAQFGLRLLAYGAIFWVMARLGRDAEFAHRALAAFAGFVGLLAAGALSFRIAGLDTLFWIGEQPTRGDVTATFVNKNHFATYAGLGALASMALIAAVMRRAIPGRAAGGRARVAALIAAMTGAALPWAIGLLVCATALLATGSRGGFVAGLVAAVALALMLVRTGQGGGWFALLLMLPAAFLLWIGAGPVLDRLFASAPGEELRSELYGRVLTAIGDAGPTGTGFGGFMEAFRPYKTDGLGRYSWDMAHNSYLENALELGWIAAGAFLLAMLWIAARCLRGLGERARRTQYAACGLASTLLVGVHALVDFSMQIPAIPAAYAMLMGIAWAQSWPTRT